MKSHEINSNPILQLTDNILTQNISWEKAIIFATSNEFLDSIKKKHWQEVVDVIKEMMSRDKNLASRVSFLALICAKNKKLQPNLWAAINFVRGTVLAYTESLNQALKHLFISKNIYYSLGMEHDVARCNMNIGIVLKEQGQYEKALKLLLLAEEVFENNGFEHESADCKMSIGNLYVELHQCREALDLFQSSLNFFSRKNDKLSVANCKVNIGNAYAYLNQFEKSLEFFISAKEFYDDKGILRSIAICDLNIGTILADLGNFSKAFEFYNSANIFFSISGNNNSMASCNHHIGNLYAVYGGYDKALNFYRLSERFYSENSNILGTARCKLSIGFVYNRISKYKQALEHFFSAKNIFKDYGLEHEIATCNMYIGFSFFMLNRFKEAISLFQMAKKYFHRKNDKIQLACCDLNIAYAHLELRQHFNSLAIFEKVNDSYNDLPYLRWRSLAGLGRTYQSLRDFPKALKFWMASIDKLDEIWYSISEEDLRMDFLGSVYSIYYTVVQLCIDMHYYNIALEYLERFKNKNLLDLIYRRDLKSRNFNIGEESEIHKLLFRLGSINNPLFKIHSRLLSSYLIEEHDALYKRLQEIEDIVRKNNHEFNFDINENITYSQIKNLIDNDKTVLVELFPMEDKTVVFLVRRAAKCEIISLLVKNYNLSKLRAHIKGLNEKYIAYIKSQGQKKIRAFNEWVNYLDNVLEELYDKIFSQIKRVLDKEGILKIIMVPFSYFHLLPLHAMYTVKNGKRRYIIDDYVMVYSPSAKIFKTCLERERSENDNVFVASSNPNDRGTLHYANIEIEAIKELFIDSYCISNATRKKIIDHCKKAHIFHYAGHAKSNTLILHDENKSDEKSEFFIDDIFTNLKLPDTYLATLSACDTGRSFPGKVDEYIGLPSAFIYAGAATVISSLWTVSDISTSLLMIKMYKFIKEGKGKAEALREAQLWLKNTENKNEFLQMISNRDIQWIGEPPELEFSRPYFWAPFICSGAG